MVQYKWVEEAIWIVMKSKVIVMAKMNNGTKSITSLEVSKRNINQKDLDKFYERINNKINFNEVQSVRIALTIINNGNMIYKHSYDAYSKGQLMEFITNLVMISNYEFHMRYDK